MQYDICFKCGSEADLAAALAPFGLIAQDDSGNTVLTTAGHNHALAYVGRVVATPAVIDMETMETTKETTFLDGEYAILRADGPLIAQIAAAPLAGAEVLSEPPAGCPTFGGWQAAPVGPTLDDLKVAACTRITAECARRRAAGVLVQFPDGQGVVQTRDEIDLINVSGVASAGLAATVAGTMPPLYFRDAANKDHELTPTQAVDFGAQVMQQLQAITKAAHDAKDAINSPEINSADRINALEVTIAWPQ